MTFGKSQQATQQQRNRQLRQKLFELLRSGKRVSYAELAASAECSMGTLHAQIYELRLRLVDCRIYTIRGLGYFMRREGEHPRIGKLASKPRQEIAPDEDDVPMDISIPHNDPLLVALRREFPDRN